MAARIIQCTEAEYHADAFAAVPSLSRSVARELITKSALHAFRMHPRLGGKTKRATEAMDDGSVLHALVLGQPDPREILDVEDYRTNAAKALRDAAIQAGRIPVKAKDATWHNTMARSFVASLRNHGVDFSDMDREVAIEWEDDGVLCRSRLDAVGVRDGLVTVYDLKFVEDASEKAVTRSCIEHGYDMQAHTSVRAIEEAKPEYAGRIDFVLVACEKPTGEVALHPMGGTMRELGRVRWERARESWRECMKASRWPGYANTKLEAPQWALVEHGADL